MIRQTKFFASILCIVLIPASRLAGQDPFDLDEIRVVAPFEPSISDAFKITLNPSIDDTLDLKLDFTYLIQPKKILSLFELEPISPARMRGEPLTKLYRGFLKGGYGSYNTPYFEGFYNSLRSNNGSVGVHLKHHSSGGGIPEVAHNAYSENLARINGQRFFRNNNLDAGVGYERNVLHYYGFKRDDFEENSPVLDSIDKLTNNDIMQQFGLLSAHTAFGSNHADSARFRHLNRLDYHWLSDHFDAAEHHGHYQAHLGRDIAADPFNLADKQYFSLDMGAEYLHSMNLTDTANTYLIGLQPRLWSRYQNFQFYIGVNATFQIDTVSFFRAYPLVGAELNIVRNRLVAFIENSGHTEKHSMLTLHQVNPFINTSANPYAFMNVKYDVGGGLKGAIGDIIGYSLSLKRASIDNHPFFVNDTSTLLNNKFSVIYDNVSRFHIRANISAKFGERFYTTLTANHYQYSLENEMEAWHTPESTFSAHLKYNIQDKIILSSDVMARSQTYGRVFDSEGMPTAAIAHPFHVDANFGIEYRYTKRLSVFLNFSNVGNRSLERWMQYPSQGFNFLGGASFAF